MHRKPLSFASDTNSTAKLTEFSEVSVNFYDAPVNNAYFNSRVILKPPVLKMADVPDNFEELKTQYLEFQEKYLALEEELKKLKLDSKDITNPSAPELKELEQPEKIKMCSRDRSKLISELLLEIHDYNGSTHPRFFIQAVSRCLGTLADSEIEQDIFVRRLIAQKLKGEAQIVAQRVNSESFREISSALNISFGRVEQSYRQISDYRNTMCHIIKARKL